MKLKVIKTYTDKYTKQLVNEGSTITESDERGKELIEKGKCIELVSKRKAKKKK
jgi:hypothetical protein